MTPADVARAARILRGGGVAAFPTETVYGLGANALDESAVAKIFEAKGRPRFDPLIVHALTAEAAFSLWESVPPLARALADAFWPGPLTLIGRKSPRVPDIVTAGLPTVAVRVPAHAVARALLEACGTPLAAPSANRFGHVSATNAQAVRDDLPEGIFVLDAGETPLGIESTVLSVSEKGAALLRPGAIPAEDIERVLGMALERDASPAERKASPGHLARHYAPRKPLYVLFPDGTLPEGARGKIALLCFRGAPDAAPKERFVHVEILSPAGDLREAACRFFAALRRLEAMDVDAIAAERFPDEGLGVALNDRLERAAER